MIKRPFHPILFPIFLVVTVLASNLNLIPLSQLFRPLGVAISVGGLLWLLGWPLFRNWTRAAAFGSFTFALLLLFGAVRGLLPLERQEAFSAPLYIVGALIVAVLAARPIKNAEALNVLSLLLLLLSLSNLGIRILTAHRAIQVDSSEARPVKAGRLPDIYYIILDGFGRQDALKSKIGFDSTPLIDGLTQRGFVVAKESRANYCQTEISLASSLNLEFVQALISEAKDAKDRKPLHDLIADNRLTRMARANGYATVGISTGFPPVSFPGVDLHLEQSTRLNLLENTLIQMTPFAGAELPGISMRVQRRDMIIGAFASLADVAGNSAKPKLVLTHILAPHPPFVFNADGSLPPRRGLFGYWDGSDYIHFVGTKDDYINGYRGQAQYISAKVLAAVDAIISKTSVRPIIVIQGDHGSKVGFDQNELTKTDTEECFPILNALLVPEAVATDIQPDLSPVNTFRIIANHLFGSKLALRPNRHWYSPFTRPFDFTAIP